MTKRILNSVIAIGFAAAIANTQATAQSNHMATIPFTFQAGGTEYPSGTYEIRKMGPAAIRIANVETRSAHFVPMPIPVDVPRGTSPKLVFQVTAEGYQLSEVWLQDAPGMKIAHSSKSETANVKVPIR